MEIAFRVDVSIQIGTGHFMRCLTVADAMKRRGAQLRFVCRYLPEHCQDILAEKGHGWVLLQHSPCESVPSDLAHANWLGTTQFVDAKDSIEALSGHAWDWVVVDHYALDVRWESALRETTKNLLVIDDIADRSHDCDVLLDQNFYAAMRTRYTGKVPEHCRLLLGPRYALLRDEFRRLREQARPRTGPIKRVLVFFGGVDRENYTGRAIEALADLGIKEPHVDVVIGAQHPFPAEVKSACATHRFDCHVQTDRMAELMAAADLAIGAGGSASWERCCLGLPVLTVSMAENQSEIAKGIDSLGAGQYLGSQGIVSVAALRGAILDLLHDESRVRSLSEKAYRSVDGLGVDRVCEALSC